MHPPPRHTVLGSQLLSVLAAPHSATILRTLAEHGPLCVEELRARSGRPPPGSLRAPLGKLRKLGAVARTGSRSRARYRLTPAGHELCPLLAELEAWLSRTPGGSRKLGSGAGEDAVQALVEGLGSGLLGTLASGPRSLGELEA